MTLFRDDTVEWIIKYWFVWFPIFLVFIFNAKLGTVDYQLERVYFVFWFIIIGVWYIVNNEGKSISTQAIFNGTHMSISGEPIICGDYAIYTNGIKAKKLFLNFDFNTKTVVIPHKHRRLVRDHEIGPVKVDRVRFEELSYDLQLSIRTHGYSEKVVWLGFFSEVFEQLQPEFTEELKRLYLQANKRATTSEEHADMNLSRIENTVSSMGRVTDPYRKKTLFAKSGDSEEEKR